MGDDSRLLMGYFHTNEAALPKSINEYKFLSFETKSDAPKYTVPFEDMAGGALFDQIHL